MTITKEDRRRLKAWTDYRDTGEWNCPDCGGKGSHYNGGTYCNGCGTPIVCAVLASKEQAHGKASQ